MKPILSISHDDLDGAVCQILLGKVFPNIEYISYKFGILDDLLKKIDYNKYEKVFLTDIHPENRDNIYLSDNIILIDHHESIIEWHDPSINKFVIKKYCGAKLTKLFLEKNFNVDLSQFNELVHLTNDYDMWIHNHFKSKELNILFWHYFPQRFRQEFSNGRVEWNDFEKALIQKEKENFQKALDELEIFPTEIICGLMFYTDKFYNELAEYFLKQRYKIIFIISQSQNSVSVRHNVDSLNIGKLVKKLEWGGGHAKAAGFKFNSFEDLKIKIKKLELILYKNFTELRK